MKHVIVIGGGFAGLSAATALAEQGCRVTVLEGRQVLGGRAYSFVDPKTGDSVDNGQHLFMGCYRETRQFLERIGCSDRLTFQGSLAINFVAAGGRRAKIRCLRLPPPFHLYSGLARLSTLSLGDRWRLRRVETALKQETPPEELDELTVDEWLIQCGQSARSRRHLWDLITIACLNEDPRIASAAPFVAVLKQAFFGDEDSSRLAFAHVGLSDLYVQESVGYIVQKGGQVRPKTPVHRLEVRQGRVTAVHLRNGERLEADEVVTAVQPSALLKLVPELIVDEHPYFSELKTLTYAPIISIHLWFDRAITKDIFVGLLDTHIQWLFNRSRILKTPHPAPSPRGEGGVRGGYISLVISGAHDFADWSEGKILTLALEELRRLFPVAKDAALLRSLVIKEMQATLSPKVGTEKIRPKWQSPIGNLWVAGDWTRTGLPATIESACLSGHACAELIMKTSFSAAPNAISEVSNA